MGKTKNILIAGGAGFIGSNLCHKLVQDPNNFIICVDNLHTGRVENISDLMNLGNFVFERRDIVDGIPDWYNTDEIYNLACPASPPHYQSDPVHTTKTCTIGVTNLLELARISGATLLQASTSEVYGDPTQHPQREDYWGNVNPNGIRSCYDEGKRCAETLCLDYHRYYGVPVKVVRIFNTYGPMMRADDGRVVSNFIVQALQGKTITIYGDGTQTRSFQYIDDLIEGMLRMMATEEDFTGPVNLGNPVEFTINKLAEKVLSMIDTDSPVRYLPLPQDDPAMRRPDISLAKARLGWQPVIELGEGLKRTIEYFRYHDQRKI